MDKNLIALTASYNDYKAKNETISDEKKEEFIT
jgi:hypothetical protein